MTRSYPEPLRVTGPLLSLVLRVEDVCQWQRYNHFHRSVFSIQYSVVPVCIQYSVIFRAGNRNENHQKGETFTFHECARAVH